MYQSKIITMQQHTKYPATSNKRTLLPFVWSYVHAILQYFVGSKAEKDKLASLGMGAFASYGVIRCEVLDAASPRTHAPMQY
jgi:hypothetical protein